jgi:DNA-binding CsgD family transcriptional regulator
LLAAARALEPLDPVLARDTYLEALAAALYGGRLGDPAVLQSVARAILEATADDQSERARDLILRGQALLAAEGRMAALPTLRRALRAFHDQRLDALELRWMWFGCRAAYDLWEIDALRTLADRQVKLARAEGALTVLPIAMTLLIPALLLDGRLDAVAVTCEEIEAIQDLTGQPLPHYGRLFEAAYRGQVEVVERRIKEVTADAQARGEGGAVSAANFAQALVYNGASRYGDAVAAARREVPYVNELATAKRALFELVEAATRTGERALAEEAFEHMASVTRPAWNDYTHAMLALGEALLRDGDAAEALYQEAIERFDRDRIPLMVGRARLLYGEVLRRQQRRVDAREQLRAAYEVLSACGMNGFAERAARELAATGETLRVRRPEALDQLTDQELNVARLARGGLTNRDIGARLFISARTAEYHLRKVFMKLGISSRAELKGALAELD